MSPTIAFCLFVLIAGTFADADLDSVPKIEERIINGLPGDRVRFTYQVQLRDRRNGQPWCSGSILSANYVLTTANCVRPGVERHIIVVADSLHRILDGVPYAVSGILRHPQHDRFKNDVAIIRTATPIQFGPSVSAVRLPTRAPPSNGNLPVVVSGWGKVGLGQDASTLQYLITSTLSNQECARRLGPRLGIWLDDSMICTINRAGQGLCNGDGGSPLVTQNGEQYGIASWGGRCGEGLPDVYTNVWHHVNWIRASTGLPGLSWLDELLSGSKL